MRGKGLRIAAVSLCMLLCCLLAQAAQAEMSLHAGYGDMVFCGRYQPLDIRITAGEEPIEGTAEVEISARSGKKDLLTMEVSLAAGETFERRIPVITLVPQSSFTLTLRENGEITDAVTYYAEHSTPRSAMVIGIPGGDAEALVNALSIDEQADPLNRSEIVRAVALGDLAMMETEREMSAFDVLMLHDGVALNDRQRERLLHWVLDGGILIAGTDAQNAAPGGTLAWAAEAAGVSLFPAKQTQEGAAGVLAALMAGTDTAYETDGLECAPVCMLEAGEDAQLFKAGESAIAAACRMGSGLMLVCGFDWRDPALVRANEEQSILRRVLLSAAPELYIRIHEEIDTPNYTIGTTAVSMQRLDTGKSIAPILLLLAVYAAAAGAGLFFLLKRKDGTKRLWYAIPALALLMCGAVILQGHMLGFYGPAASSLRVTSFDAEGRADVQEIVQLSYAGQERTSIQTQSGEAVERMSSGYASGYVSEYDELELRDVIHADSVPSLELPGAAAWTVRSLVILKETEPEGGVSAQAEMTMDGLRAQIANDTDMQLEDAVLLTSLGYARIGTLAPGQQVSVLIARPEGYLFDKEGQPVITEGELLPYTGSLYTIADAYTYPELQNADGEGTEFSENEQYERSLTSSLVRSGSADSGEFFCMLAAKTEDEEGTALLVGGEPVKRHAHTSMVFANMDCSMTGSDGFVYIPKDMTKALYASVDENGVPESGAELKSAYVETDRDAVFAYRPEGIGEIAVSRLIFATDSWMEMGGLTAEIYDHEAGVWTALEGTRCAFADETLAARAISDDGEIFMRYAGERESGLYAPQITVEGVMAQ